MRMSKNHLPNFIRKQLFIFKQALKLKNKVRHAVFLQLMLKWYKRGKLIFMQVNCWRATQYFKGHC